MSSHTSTLLRNIAEHLKVSDRGYFLAFEGGDGSGKTTQAKLLEKELAKLGTPILFTFEPGATKLGQQLRELVMHGPEDVDPRTEALLYAADRAYHVATVVRPALQRGTTVITDRYIDSSVAYQGIGRELGEEDVRNLSLWATEGLLPDLVLVFQVDPEVALGRIGRSLDRLERAGSGFHDAVADHYARVGAEDPQRYWAIPATGTVEQTFDELVRTLAIALGVCE